MAEIFVFKEQEEKDAMITFVLKNPSLSIALLHIAKSKMRKEPECCHHEQMKIITDAKIETPYVLGLKIWQLIQDGQITLEDY